MYESSRTEGGRLGPVNYTVSANVSRTASDGLCFRLGGNMRYVQDMSIRTQPSARILCVAFVSGLLVAASGAGFASDHGDVPVSTADITDLHAFVVGANLVLAVSTNAAIPPSVANYAFPTNVAFEINIDVDSEVWTEDPMDLHFHGGTIVDPDRVREDITFRIRFGGDGAARVQPIVRGHVQNAPHIVNFFAGLRDDPLIRRSRAGRNVGAIVLEVPLASIVREQPTLLIWATANVDDLNEEDPQDDLVGRAFRRNLNHLHPKHHLSLGGERPNVMIYDIFRHAAFPNGRALTDDVVDLICLADGQEVGDCGPYRADKARDPFPPGPATENDQPFLDTFPYLAPPHLPS